MSKINIWYPSKSDDEGHDNLYGNSDSDEPEKTSSEKRNSIDTENDCNVSDDCSEAEESPENDCNVSDDCSEAEESPENWYLSEMKGLNKKIGDFLMPNDNFKREIDEQKAASTLKFLTESKKDEELYFKNLKKDEMKKKKSSKVGAFHRSKFCSSDRKSSNRKTEVDFRDDVDSSPEDFDDLQGVLLNLAPIYQDKRKVYTPMKRERYTVDQKFRDHWNNNSKMDEDKLKRILKLWASDNWEGLYDPPEWLTTEMFFMALTDEPSNKIKLEKLIEATENLEIAKRTKCNTLASVLEKGAMNVGSSSSNESFMKCAKSICLSMGGIYRNTKELYREQNAESFNLKKELTSVIKIADHDSKDVIASYEELLKDFDEEIEAVRRLTS